MQISDLAAQIQDMQQRIAVLQRASDTGSQDEMVIAQVFEELQTSLEEFRVIEEVLLQQNLELLAAQEDLAAEQQRYQELFDLAPDGYVVTTPSGIIEEANQAACRLLNTPRTWLIGKPLPLFVAEPDRRKFRNRLSELRAADRIEDREVRFQPQQGKPFIAGLSATAVRDQAGHVTAARWLLRDVTEHRWAEEQVRRLNAELEQRVADRTAELEAANRQKDELLHQAKEALKVRDTFLTIASHELKTPLTSLIGYVYLLQQEMVRNQEQRSEKHGALQVIMHQSQRLNQLIELMLDLVHLQQGHVPIERQIFDIADLAREVTAELSQTLSRHTIQPEIQDEPLPILGDARRMQQVLQNLLQNAVKYTPAGGSIEVRVWRQDSEVRSQGDCTSPRGADRRQE